MCAAQATRHSSSARQLLAAARPAVARRRPPDAICPSPLVGAPVARLWHVLAALPAGRALALLMHPDQSSDEWHDANRICSCVLALDLTALRRVRLTDSAAYRAAGLRAAAPSLFAAMYGALGDAGYAGVKLGDQGYWWAIVNQTELAEPLEFEGEVSACLINIYATSAEVGAYARMLAQEHDSAALVRGTPYAGRTILPKLVHLGARPRARANRWRRASNCLDGLPVYWEWPHWDNSSHWQYLDRRWRGTVQHHIGYKWL
jgi:hypothetical protein